MPESFTHKIDKPWTAINRITNETVSRNIIAGVLLDSLISNLMQFSKFGLEKFIEEWEKLDCLAGNLTKIVTAKKTLTGIAKGISEQGGLLLEIKNGDIITVNSGDASLVSV
jgi:BirA family biotin operon repressor/biotin-[acetyl-CoA-carboxylase] ligase